MSPKLVYILSVTALLGGLSLFAQGQAIANEVFKGQTIRLIIGTSAGGAQDLWGRFVAQHLGRNIPGTPEIVVQNMPGAGSMVAANHLFNIAKPDGLTLAMIGPALYLDQLMGSKEVQFDWAKFTWIGSPERIDQVLFIRADSRFETIEDLRRAAEALRCAATGNSTPGYFFPKLLEEAIGIKLQLVVGYGGGGDMDLAIERGEIQCRAGTVSAFVTREPTRTWLRDGFVRPLVQSGTTRYAKLPSVPTVYELMDVYRTPNAILRLTKAVLSSGDLGRPFVAPPGVAADRVKILRDSFMKTMKDPMLLADAAKRKWEVDPLSGEELEAIAKDIVAQPPEVIDRLKKLVGKK